MRKFSLTLASFMLVFLCIGPANGANCSSNPVQAVNNASSGAVVTLCSGNFKISSSMHPRSGVSIVGQGRKQTHIWTDSVSLIFSIDSKVKNVHISHMSISGAINICPGQNCGATGDAINGGYSVYVTYVRLYNNGRAGIGGISGQLIVRHSRMDHNGTIKNVCCRDYVSAGIKIVHPATITDSRVDHNYGNGIHCDRDCGAFNVRRTVVTDNNMSGIHIELGSGPSMIAGNTVQHNNLLGFKTHSGINITDSMNVTVKNNILGENKGPGIEASEDSRAKTTGFHLNAIRIFDNTRNGDMIRGCGYAGVTCG
jgi:parallel beta-helix repeat protein